MRHYYIGLSVTYHDPALAIIDQNGAVLFAEATERYLQHKRAMNCEADTLLRLPELLQRYCRFPCQFTLAINWRKKRPWYENVVAALGCLDAPGLLKEGFKRVRSPLPNYQLHHMIACQRNKIRSAGLNTVRVLRECYPQAPIHFADFPHHLTHAATACFGSPFTEAACAVIDSFGERGSMAFYRFVDGRLQLIHENCGTGSLGFYYMKVTELCGFDWLKGEEWKVMGLAPYGRLNPELYDILQNMMTVDGLRCRHPAPAIFKQADRLQGFRRQQNQSIEMAADIAYTGQYFFAELSAKLLQNLQERTGAKQLAFAGGCALNSAFNGQISERTGFERVYIPSAPADDGTALGAAWLALRRDRPNQPLPSGCLSPYLGSDISDSAVEQLRKYHGGLKISHLPGRICETTAQLLADGALVAWVQGRAEFGPRALGNRSILADPRHAATKDRINAEIKFRERFRPFAPSILAEYAEKYFENHQSSPYMDKTLRIKAERRDRLAAVCHVDGTGRLQTVTREFNPRFYHLIEQFHRISGVPALLNTSFNVMGKPMVHTLEDALAVFLTSGLDHLVINDYLISKLRHE
ncbi:carbamoyltransferase family protein [Methylomarinum vadi]|uniref:carbamoyltransferase family protein n=1 Tax=Methylomarinum vadi TaxID=438855 RepID=UPI0004DF4071|nr:carbamoyltransferase C-terminal domain-containing protein [Methylomarinum vadi]